MSNGRQIWPKHANPINTQAFNDLPMQYAAASDVRWSIDLLLDCSSSLPACKRVLCWPVWWGISYARVPWATNDTNRSTEDSIPARMTLAQSCRRCRDFVSFYQSPTSTNENLRQFAFELNLLCGLIDCRVPLFDTRAVGLTTGSTKPWTKNDISFFHSLVCYTWLTIITWSTWKKSYINYSFWGSITFK